MASPKGRRPMLTKSEITFIDERKYPVSKLQYPLPTHPLGFRATFELATENAVARAIDDMRRRVPPDEVQKPLDGDARRQLVMRLADLDSVRHPRFDREEFATMEAYLRQAIARTAGVREFAETATSIVELNQRGEMKIHIVPTATWANTSATSFEQAMQLRIEGDVRERRLGRSEPRE